MYSEMRTKKKKKRAQRFLCGNIYGSLHQRYLQLIKERDWKRPQSLTTERM